MTWSAERLSGGLSDDPIAGLTQELGAKLAAFVNCTLGKVNLASPFKYSSSNSQISTLAHTFAECFPAILTFK
jgi:hypothetical protein